MRKKALYPITFLFILISCNSEVNNEILIKFKAFNKGTQGFSKADFKFDMTFKLENSSFFSTKTFNGKWEKRKDTLFLIFDVDTPYNLSDTNLIYKNYIVPINQIQLADSLHILNRYFKLD